MPFFAGRFWIKRKTRKYGGENIWWATSFETISCTSYTHITCSTHFTKISQITLHKTAKGKYQNYYKIENNECNIKLYDKKRILNFENKKGLSYQHSVHFVCSTQFFTLFFKNAFFQVFSHDINVHYQINTTSKIYLWIIIYLYTVHLEAHIHQRIYHKDLVHRRYNHCRIDRTL